MGAEMGMTSVEERRAWLAEALADAKRKRANPSGFCMVAGCMGEPEKPGGAWCAGHNDAEMVRSGERRRLACLRTLPAEVARCS
jgi:hypothetical protein